MHFPASLAAAVLLLGRAACAQVATPPPAPAGLGPSIMHLSAQATIKVAPDELVAGLAAVAVAPTAAAAQRRVNEMLAKAKATAAGTPGTRTSFRGYAVFYSEEKPPHWTAQQTIEGRERGGGARPGGPPAGGRAGARGPGLGNLLGTSGVDAARRHAEGANHIAKASNGGRAGARHGGGPRIPVGQP